MIDDNRVLISLIACSVNYETAVTFTYGHFNKVVFAVIIYSEVLFPSTFLLFLLYDGIYVSGCVC